MSESSAKVQRRDLRRALGSEAVKSLPEHAAGIKLAQLRLDTVERNIQALARDVHALGEQIKILKQLGV